MKINTEIQVTPVSEPRMRRSIIFQPDFVTTSFTGPMNLSHFKCAVRTMAKFHAVGLCHKGGRPVVGGNMRRRWINTEGKAKVVALLHGGQNLFNSWPGLLFSTRMI